MRDKTVSFLWNLVEQQTHPWAKRVMQIPRYSELLVATVMTTDLFMISIMAFESNGMFHSVRDRHVFITQSSFSD